MRLSLLTVAFLTAVSAHAQEPAPAPWGSPTVDNGACCQSIDEVRKNKKGGAWPPFCLRA